jgi:thiol-disulfide isomerase/thioredoxin
MSKKTQSKHRVFFINKCGAIKEALAGGFSMKSTSILIIVLLFAAGLHAQGVKLPPFTMTQTNGKTFKAESLPMGKPIVVIYFSPECEHCQKLMNEFFKRTNEFKKASVVMITYLSLETVKKFEAEYKISNYPNIYVGTEGISFYLKNYYGLLNMPFTALYDKNGNLVSTYRQEATLSDIAKKLAIL